MKTFKMFLFLLASLFAAPLALADEIGSGSPEESNQSTAAVPAESDAEAECATWRCLVNEVRSWFE